MLKSNEYRRSLNEEHTCKYEWESNDLIYTFDEIEINGRKNTMKSGYAA